LLSYQVSKVRELEEFNMNRKVSGPRKVYVNTFNEWMEKNGAKIDGVEIAEFGNQGNNLKLTSSTFIVRKLSVLALKMPVSKLN
jgi:hypothetical protein